MPKKQTREERRGPRDREKEKEFAALREKTWYMSKVKFANNKNSLNPYIPF